MYGAMLLLDTISEVFNFRDLIQVFAGHYFSFLRFYVPFFGFAGH